MLEIIIAIKGNVPFNMAFIAKLVRLFAINT